MSKYRALLLACLLCAACPPPITDSSQLADGGPPTETERALAECQFEKREARFAVEMLTLELATCEGGTP